MTFDLPHLTSGRSLALAVATSACGLAALALANTDALIGRSMDRALATASSSAGTTAIAGNDLETMGPATGRDAVWLTHVEHAAVPPAQGLAKIGDRISMVVDGGRAVDLEVMAVTELAHVPDAISAVGVRLVMVTAREAADGERRGRTVRVIVEADDAGTATTTGAQPARTL